MDALHDPAVRRLLADPARWRLVLSGLPPEAPRVARPRGRAHPTHAHPHRELLLALWGDVPYGRAGEVFRCQPGTWLVFPPLLPHDDGYLDAGPLGHLWVFLVAERAFARVLTREHGRQTSGPLLALPDADAREALSAIEAAEGLAASAPPLARQRALGGLAGVAGALLAPPPATDTQQAAIEAICAHILHQAGAGVTLRQLARIAGYSPFHFARVFRRRVGCSVHTFVDRCRVHAVATLRRQGRRHQDIAQDLGFSCPSAFSRWLRSHQEALASPPPMRPPVPPPLTQAGRRRPRDRSPGSPAQA